MLTTHQPVDEHGEFSLGHSPLELLRVNQRRHSPLIEAPGDHLCQEHPIRPGIAHLQDQDGMFPPEHVPRRDDPGEYLIHEVPQVLVPEQKDSGKTRGEALLSPIECDSLHVSNHPSSS